MPNRRLTLAFDRQLVLPRECHCARQVCGTEPPPTTSNTLEGAALLHKPKPTKPKPTKAKAVGLGRPRLLDCEAEDM